MGESRNEKVHLVPDPAAGDAELRAEAEVADDVKKPSEDLLLLLRELHGLLTTTLRGCCSGKPAAMPEYPEKARTGERKKYPGGLFEGILWRRGESAGERRRRRGGRRPPRGRRR